MTDEDLMLGVVQGRGPALEALLARYEAPLAGFFHRHGCKPTACRELVQTVAVRLYEERQRYDASRSLAPWLYGIARNVWREHVRERKRRRETPLGPWTDAAVDGGVTALDPATAAEQQDLVCRALARLRPEDRLPVILRHWHGLTYEEIAEALDVPLGTVKWRLHTAHRKLASWLALSSSNGREQ